MLQTLKPKGNKGVHFVNEIEVWFVRWTSQMMIESKVVMSVLMYIDLYHESRKRGCKGSSERYQAVGNDEKRMPILTF